MWAPEEHWTVWFFVVVVVGFFVFWFVCLFVCFFLGGGGWSRKCIMGYFFVVLSMILKHFINESDPLNKFYLTTMLKCFCTGVLN